MNQPKLANALRQLGEAVYEIADALLDTATDSSVPVSAATGREASSSPAMSPAPIPPSFDELPPDQWEAQPSLADVSTDFADQGSEAICPAHKRPYKEGRYGLFCTSKADDPAWANKNGYCTITPKNAAQYLRVKAAA